MKKLLTLALTLGLTLTLAACGGNADAPAPGGTDQIRQGAAEGGGTESGGEAPSQVPTVEAGKLTVATSPDFAPYEFYAIDDSGTPQLAGFDMALAQYIADELGLELEVIPMDFNGTIMELAAGKVDLGMAGYSPEPDRAEKMAFSDVYITGGQSFVCLQTDKDAFTALTDVNKAEYTIGAQIASIQAKLAKEHAPDADIVELAKVTDIVAQVLTGKLDGAFVETMVAEAYAKNYPDLCVALEVPYDAPGSVVGVNKTNPALLEKVNEAISKCKDSGEFDKYVIAALEQASGEIIQGLLEE